MGQIQLTVSLITIALFSIALVGFGVNFAADNNAAISISNDPEITTFDTQGIGNVTPFNTKTKTSYESLLNTTVEAESGVPTGTAPFSLTTTNALGTTSNIVKIGYIKIFGNEEGFGIFITTFIGILGFMFALYLYKTFRGNPD